jgi:outer membrane protein assembly factor BamD
MNPGAAAAATPAAKAAAADSVDAAAAAAAPAAAPAVPAAPLAFHDVPTAGANPNTGSAVDTTVPSGTTSSGAASSRSMGVEIITPSAAAKPSDANGGLKAIGPENATPLPAVEKAGDAPDAVNDIKPGTQPAAQTAPANGKKVKPEFDSSDESSSKHKKKKGLKKLNPF